MAINVLMVGGRRCGKTSALAVMFDQMIHDTVSKYFTTSDETSYQTKDEERQDTVSAKINDLKRFFSIKKAGTFLVDSGPTMFSWQYKSRLTIPGTRRYLEIEYTDVPGEWFRAGTEGRIKFMQELEEYVSNSNVFVVMVDTPYLMETEDYMNDAVNCVSDIHHNVISKIHDDDGEKAKMVVFVPIKCEKWAKEGRLDEVTRKIEEVYSVSIRHLNAYSKVSVCVLPIQTAGNIVFSEFKEAWLLNGNEKKDRCCKLSDSLVRMADGIFVELKDTDKLNPDIEAVIDGVGFSRPYAWYNIDLEATCPGYCPYNCDQLALHILRFSIQKTLDEEARGGLWGWILGMIGNVTKGDMINKLNELNNGMVFKDNVEGIKYIKTVY